MTLSRWQFFLLLLLLLVAPFVVYKASWLINSRKTIGVVDFIGHGNLGSTLGMTTYPVISFINGKDTVIFKGNQNTGLSEGDKVEVRYQVSKPSDAKINTVVCIWGDTLVYALWPLGVIILLFILPDIFPRKSKVEIGGRQIIKVVEYDK